jgi:hypothetical protein
MKMKWIFILLAGLTLSGCSSPSIAPITPSSPEELQSRLNAPAATTVFQQISFQEVLNSLQAKGIPMVIHNIMIDRQVQINLPKGTSRRALLDEICRQADLSWEPWENVVTVTKNKGMSNIRVDTYFRKSNTTP